MTTEQNNEHQVELSNILGINRFEHEHGYYSEKTKPATWAEIYVEIGKLQERALYTQTEFRQTTGSTMGTPLGLSNSNYQ